MAKRTLTRLDETFYATLVLKAADSLLEVIGGILILAVSPASIGRLTRALTQNELSKEPHDFIANHILKIGQDFSHSSSRYFAAFYLLSHGLVKIFVIIALFKQKLWAYPTMIVVLGLFIIYQLYRLTFAFSIGLVLLTIFDLVVIWLTWLEYKRHRSKLVQA